MSAVETGSAWQRGLTLCACWKFVPATTAPATASDPGGPMTSAVIQVGSIQALSNGTGPKRKSLSGGESSTLAHSPRRVGLPVGGCYRMIRLIVSWPPPTPNSYVVASSSDAPNNSTRLPVRCNILQCQQMSISGIDNQYCRAYDWTMKQDRQRPYYGNTRNDNQNNIVMLLRADGLSLGRIGKALGITRQRVQQIIVQETARRERARRNGQDTGVVEGHSGLTSHLTTKIEQHPSSVSIDCGNHDGATHHGRPGTDAQQHTLHSYRRQPGRLPTH